MIEQVLINLLQNAEQALVEVTNPKVSINASLNKRGHVVIDVEDNGPGIDDELSKKIFVPFFSTKPEGSGIGLSLSRQIIRNHGGHITLESDNSKGTSFRIMLPVE